MGEIIVWILFPRIFFESQIQVYKASCIGGIHVRFLSGVSTLDIPSRELTYPTLGEKENHHLQKCRVGMGYVIVPWKVSFLCKNPSFNPRKTQRPHLFFSIPRSAPDGPPGSGSGNVSNDSESAMLRATRCRKFKGMVESGKVHQTERNFTPQKCTQVGGEGATSCVFGTFFLDGVLKPTIDLCTVIQ